VLTVDVASSGKTFTGDTMSGTVTAGAFGNFPLTGTRA